MTRITVETTMPDGFLQTFLQHLRDFEFRHDPERTGCVHMNIGVEAPDLPAETMQTIFSNVRPPFESLTVFSQGKASS